METSDSECFESADEELSSDEEDASVVAKTGMVNAENYTFAKADNGKNVAEAKSVDKSAENIDNKKLEISRLIQKYVNYDVDHSKASNETQAGAGDAEAANEREAKKDCEQEIRKEDKNEVTMENKTEATIENNKQVKEVNKKKETQNSNSQNVQTQDESILHLDTKETESISCKEIDRKTSKEIKSTTSKEIKSKVKQENEEIENKVSSEDSKGGTMESDLELKPKNQQEIEKGNEENMWGDDEDWGEPIESNAAPPKYVECWEPGVNYSMDEYNSKFGQEKSSVAIDKTALKDSASKSIKNQADEKINHDVEEENLWKDDEDNLWNDDEKLWNDQQETNKYLSKNEMQENLSNKVQEKLCKNETQGNLSKNEDEENLWDDDEDWEPITKTPENKPSLKLPEKQQQEPQEPDNSSWGGWSSWGLSSVISTATAGVSTLTQGITSVLESGIGVPDPEELARLHKEQKEKNQDEPEEPDDPKSTPNLTLGLGLGNLVSGVSQITKLVEKTGSKVITGGLDTLETIGKKTMEVLQENDPGLKKKRAFLKIDSDKPILSQILREAKEKAEQEDKMAQQPSKFKKPNYESIFDDHQGLVHLEALEMLSKQCDIKLESLTQSLTGNNLKEMQETLEQVKELCEIPEEEEEEFLEIPDVRERLETISTDMNVAIKYNGLLETWEEVENWLEKVDVGVCSENEMHKQAIESLAHLTAIGVEQYHKIGELLLVKDHRSTADEADSLVQLTNTLTTLIGNIASKFSNKLTEISRIANNKEAVNELITNVFFEAANSGSYIQDAFKLTIPVLQVGAV